MPVAKRVVVRGRVQGVFFRASAREMATSYGVSGSATNRSDGSVELVFEGSEDAVDRAVAWCRHGPEYARVDAIEVDDTAPQGASGFTVT